MQILPSIYLVGSGEFLLTYSPTSHPFYDCHVFVLAAGRELVLIDGGYGESVDQIVANIEMWGLDPRRLTRCLLTHAHHDHARAAAEWQERYGLLIYASGPAADALANPDVRTLAYSCPEGSFPPCQVDGQLADGDRVEVGDLVVAVMAIPGHSAGDLAYVVEMHGRRIAFVGDILSSDGAEQFELGYPFDADHDSAAQVRSLYRLYECRPDVLLPAHGALAMSRGFHWLGKALHEVEKTALRTGGKTDAP